MIVAIAVAIAYFVLGTTTLYILGRAAAAGDQMLDSAPEHPDEADRA